MARDSYYAHVPPARPKVGNKHANRQVFDLGLAVQSVLPYDGIHLTVKRLAASDQFNVFIHATDISWTEGVAGKVLNKVMVIAEAFDRKGNAVGHSIKLSTLQDRENSEPRPSTGLACKALWWRSVGCVNLCKFL